ncbi:MAG: hypothetical protein ACLFS7_03225 [Desulfosudaceae bacterium]
MNLKAKPYLEKQYQKARDGLAARVTLLKERGLDPGKLAKDPHVRKLKADIRKAGSRLQSLADTEKINLRKLQKKQEKESGAAAAPDEADPPAGKKQKSAKSPKARKD